MSHSAVDFVHLHTHTHYSLLDGACRTKDLLGRCKKLGMDTLAITDHGNMYGVIEFYNKAKDAGIKPIIGMEAYIAPDGRTNREAKSASAAYYHLILLAKNLTGYKNLVKLSTAAFLEGFHYRPRIDKELLQQYNEGLICTSACISGEIPKHALSNNIDASKKSLEEYLAIFGTDRFFLEIQSNGLDDQKFANSVLIDLAQDYGVGLVATNDVHYVMQDDARAHDVLVRVGRNERQSDDNKLVYRSDQFYLRSPEEMASLFEDHPEAIANTVEIARQCNVELDFSERHAPVYKPPGGEKTRRLPPQAGIRQRQKTLWRHHRRNPRAHRLRTEGHLLEGDSQVTFSSCGTSSTTPAKTASPAALAVAVAARSWAIV